MRAKLTKSNTMLAVLGSTQIHVHIPPELSVYQFIKKLTGISTHIFYLKTQQQGCESSINYEY